MNLNVSSIYPKCNVQPTEPATEYDTMLALSELDCLARTIDRLVTYCENYSILTSLKKVGKLPANIDVLIGTENMVLIGATEAVAITNFFAKIKKMIMRILAAIQAFVDKIMIRIEQAVAAARKAAGAKTSHEAIYSRVADAPESLKKQKVYLLHYNRIGATLNPLATNIGKNSEKWAGLANADSGDGNNSIIAFNKIRDELNDILSIVELDDGDLNVLINKKTNNIGTVSTAETARYSTEIVYHMLGDTSRYLLPAMDVFRALQTRISNTGIIDEPVFTEVAAAQKEALLAIAKQINSMHAILKTILVWSTSNADFLLQLERYTKQQNDKNNTPEH